MIARRALPLRLPEIAMRPLKRLRRATRAPLFEFFAVLMFVGVLTGASPVLADTPSRPLASNAAQPNAVASDPSGAPTMRLSYQDLNLSTPQGIAALYLRIRRAAMQVCEEVRHTTGSRLDPTYDRCVQGAVTATVKQIASPGLAALEVEERVLGDAASRAQNLCGRPGRAKLII
jgi:UrcA family protein